VRWGILLVLAGCGVRVGVPGEQADATVDSPTDTAVTPVDVPADARPCAGGDAATAVDDGSCIVLFSTPRDFAAADAACVAFGARLAILDTADRDAVARSMIGADNVFIGLTDAAVEGTFVWVDGTPLTFQNFASGEPNNANGAFEEDCAMYSGSRAGWDDRPCSNAIPNATAPGEYPYLCLF